MTKQTINVGTTANDKKGDSLRTAFQKVNANFTELYVALGLDSGGLNLGAFQFVGSTISTTDSSSITIDQATTISSNLNVGGDILPITPLGGNLGSPSSPFKSLYVSSSTVYFNNVPLSINQSGQLTVNGSQVGGNVAWTDITGKPTIPTLTSQLTNDSGFATATSSTVFTNKTIDIAFGNNNTFQIQGNSITSYSGSGAVVALTTLPTLYGINLGNSSLTADGGTGNYYWKPTFADGTGTIHKAGVYKSNPDANNSLFTLGANGAGTMSLAVEGSVFIGNALPSNNGGLTTDYGGWLVVQAGAKFGGDLNTIGNFILDTPGNYVRFGDGTTQTTAADFGYLDLDKDTIKGTAGYQYTFATDGYFTNSTSSESLSYFFVTYNTTNTNIAAGWTVVGGTANTTVSSVTYPVAGYPGVIQVNLTQPAASTAGFYPVTVTSPDRLRVEIQPNPGTNDKFAFTTSGLTFPDTTVQTTAWAGIPGPYADDAAAATAGVAVGYPYHKTGTSGQVFVRLA